MHQPGHSRVPVVLVICTTDFAPKVLQAMNKSDAIAFLEKHQPLPDVLDEHLHRELHATWHYFRQNPDPAAVPLLLQVFGDGDAGGIYQRFEDLLDMYPTEEVVPHLVAQLSSIRRSIRYWSAQFAARFPDERLVKPLTQILENDDSDLRAAAATALGKIGSSSSKQALKEAFLVEADAEVKELISCALSD